MMVHVSPQGPSAVSLASGRRRGLLGMFQDQQEAGVAGTE